MSEYDAKYAVCPYYRRISNNRICCEGLDKRNTINLVFEDVSGIVRHKNDYCFNIDNYPRCRICGMLDRKYEDEEE